MATRRQRAIDTPRLAADFRRVMKVLEHTPSVDKRKRVARAEFQARARRVAGALRAAGHEVGLVFSDEHASIFKFESL